MVDTSYNPSYAPYARWAVQQAPVPASTHNLPASIAASSSASSSLIVTEGFSLISVGVTLSQNGSLSIQRYLDAGGTVPQGGSISVALSAGSPGNLDVLDGKPFASFIVTVTNSNGSSAAMVSNVAVLLQASNALAYNTGAGQPVALSGNAATDGSTTITTGGTAQTLFGGTVPVNGFAICNPDPSNDLWVSDSTTAAANGIGTMRVVANGGYYATEAGQKPLGTVSIIGAVTGQKITARRW